VNPPACGGRAGWAARGFAVLLLVLAAACQGGSDLAAVSGFSCGGIAGVACPPLTRCDHGRFECVVEDETTCGSDDDCALSGYGCIDGACVPVDLCGAHDECQSGLCFDGPMHERYSSGICVELSTGCGPATCPVDACRLCIWGAWRCVDRDRYPAALCSPSARGDERP
jgi:hypothetical protein